MNPKPSIPVEFPVRLSTEGQLVLPKEILERHGWSAGIELVLEDWGDRVVLREVQGLPETRLEDLIGCTGYRGPARTLQEMEAGAEGRRIEEESPLSRAGVSAGGRGG